MYTTFSVRYHSHCEEDQMDFGLQTGLLLLSAFAGLWAMFYARRAFLNTKKILDKLGR
jgi:hypothetical protein